jgi:hypothetical protein
MAGLATRERATPVTVSRKRSTRAGPLAGWSWRDARCAVKFGKQAGAWAVELRQNGMRIFVQDVILSRPQASTPGCTPARPRREERRRDDASSSPTSSSAGSAPTGTLSNRKRRSVARLQEFQHRRRLDRLRGLFTRVLKRVRFNRMWQVHNEWYAARPSDSACNGAEDQPIVNDERMDVEIDGATRASADAEDSPSCTAGQWNLAALEFVPGLATAAVVDAWLTAANDPRAVLSVTRAMHAAARARSTGGGDLEPPTEPRAPPHPPDGQEDISML